MAATMCEKAGCYEPAFRTLVQIRPSGRVESAQVLCESCFERDERAAMAMHSRAWRVEGHPLRRVAA